MRTDPGIARARSLPVTMICAHTQALNVLMLKVLEHSCRTDIFVALLALSRGRPAELASAPPEQAVKFFDLAVKCLIKLTKALTPTLEVRADEHAHKATYVQTTGLCTVLRSR